MVSHGLGWAYPGEQVSTEAINYGWWGYTVWQSIPFLDCCGEEWVVVYLMLGVFLVNTCVASSAAATWFQVGSPNHGGFYTGGKV